MPSGSEFPTDAEVYQWLGESQIDVFTRLSVFAPLACVIAPTQLTTADNGLTYTFATDSSLPTSFTDVYPIGVVKLYRTRNDIPDFPMIEGVEYLMEGNRIRMPDFVAFSGTAPYYQCLTLPTALDGTTAPTLKPVQARELMIDLASMAYFRAVSDTESSNLWEDRFNKDWSKWLGAIQAQYARSGSIAATHTSQLPARHRWYRGLRGY